MKYLDSPDEFDKRQLLRMQDLLNRDHYSRGQLGALASALLALRDLFHWHDPDCDFHFTDNVATVDSCSTASSEQIQIMGDRLSR